MQGVLWFGINSEDTANLDSFECQYDRTKVKITTEDGVTHDAYVYVFKDPKELLEDKLWDPKYFEEEHM